MSILETTVAAVATIVVTGMLTTAAVIVGSAVKSDRAEDRERRKRIDTATPQRVALSRDTKP